MSLYSYEFFSKSTYQLGSSNFGGSKEANSFEMVLERALKFAA
jgi:hypothetical protein